MRRHGERGSVRQEVHRWESTPRIIMPAPGPENGLWTWKMTVRIWHDFLESPEDRGVREANVTMTTTTAS
eukprot:8149358-Pyramimonas_sp.AAC.1